MLEYIQDKSIFWRKATLLYALIFVLFRVISYLTFPYPFIMSGILIVLMFLFAILYYHAPPYAFLLLLIEFFLGGSGHFFTMFGISIRTLFLICFFTLTVMHQAGIHFYHEQKHIPNSIAIGIGLILISTITSSIIGIRNGAGIDAIHTLLPFMYLLIIFPAYAMYRRYSFLKHATAQLAVITILGTAIYTLIQGLIFGLGIASIGGAYQLWYEQAHLGFIRILGSGMVELYEPSHVLIVPLLLLVTSLLMRSERHHLLWWLLHAALILKLIMYPSIVYILALLVGLCILYMRHKPLRWIGMSLYTVVLYIVLYSSLLLIFRISQQTGVAVSPTTFVSLFSEIPSIAQIVSTIQSATFFGYGLGTPTIHPSGYLSMLSMRGIVGTAIYLMFLLGIGTMIIKKIHAIYEYHDFYVGLLAAFVSLLVMEIGSPVLSQTFGIFAIVFAVLIITKPVQAFDQFIIFLYQLFHKKKT